MPNALLLILPLTLSLLMPAGVFVAPSAVAADLPAGPVNKINRANQQRFGPHIARIAQRYGVEAALVHAVISAESGYEPNAVSPAGAIGMMQVMPETAASYGVENLHDPVTNIDVGTRHLKQLLRKYKNISHALAAYNAGEGTMQRHRRAVTYLETRKYVVRVINFYMRYKKS